MNKIIPLDMFLSSTNVIEESSDNKLPIDFIFEISEFILSLPEQYRKKYYNLKKYKRFIKELRERNKQHLQKIDEEWETQCKLDLEQSSFKKIDIDNFL